MRNACATMSMICAVERKKLYFSVATYFCVVHDNECAANKQKSVIGFVYVVIINM
jgi:hypothetical protein